VDNGNGTVTDKRTCLVWEKKTGYLETGIDCPDSGHWTCADPHNVSNRYLWSLGEPWLFNGPAATDFLAKLNAHPGFAGHTDWRLPSSAGRPDWGPMYETGADPELESILDCSRWPCIDPIFGPTNYFAYWSSSTYAPFPAWAWSVCFGGPCWWVPSGNVANQWKNTFWFAVRAVRSDR
jgi:hypothetical protein